MENQKHILSFLLPLFLFLLGFHQNLAVEVQNAKPAIVRVGVVLDLNSTDGRRSKTSISMAIDDFYAERANFNTKVVMEYRDSMSNVVSAASAAMDLLKNSEVQAIMGPQTSTETTFIANMCNKSQVPLLSFSATSPSISPSYLPFFVRANINDSAQSVSIAAFVQHFSWHSVVPIYEDSEYGSGIIPSLIDDLQLRDIDIPDLVAIPIEATDEHIDAKLYHLTKFQTRVFVVHMLPVLSSRLFLRAEEIGMMSKGYVWLVTDSVGNVIDTLESDVRRAMEGVLLFRPYVAPSYAIKNFSIRFKTKFRQDNPGIQGPIKPSVYQFWAYDAVWAMAIGVEKLSMTNPSFVIPQNGTTDLDRVGVSQNGLTLLQEILDTTFNGLAGTFQLVDGQLLLSAFEIVNVIGYKSARTIGFWTQDQVFKCEIESSKGSCNNNSLKSIIWPGDSNEKPKGWDIPKLKVGVPVKHGFLEFVSITGSKEPKKPTHGVTGFSIDVFEAALKNLSYALPFEYYPFVDDNDAYDDLVCEVSNKNFDAVVGDITIRFNRTRYVDFTLPYTESGVSMVVRVRTDTSKSIWIFLTPLPTKLWLTSFAFFFFTGFVVWVIEHRINPEFRGTPWQQFGVIYYFAFSTLVFAHKEKLVSNLSRFVIIVWVFVVLILTQSYTANLASMLTVQQLQPSIHDVNELKSRGYAVGYQHGSFVKELLEDLQLTNLKPYSTHQEYADALDQGTDNGGVAAIFDEIPYLKVFFSKHAGDKYTTAGPTYKADGFGFAFPRRSPFVADISRAILSVTEGDVMNGIERKWELDTKSVTFLSQSTTTNSTRLEFYNFAGLFILTGAISGLMLLAYLAMFIYKERVELLSHVTEGRSPLKIVRLWFGHYDDFDHNSPSVRQYFRSSSTGGRRGSHETSARAVPLPELAGPASPTSPTSEFNFTSTRESTPELFTPSNGGSGEEVELTVQG